MNRPSLQAFGPGIWLADGPQAEVAGFRYPTRMAVIRMTGGGLLAWSPVALTSVLRAELAALGDVRLLVAPNSLHHLHLAQWREAFPDAPLHAAPGLARKRPDIACDAELGDVPVAADFDQVVFRGNALTTEVVFFHRPSGAVLFTDLLQQFPPGWFRGWRALVARADLMTQPQPAVPRKFRLAFTDRRAARDAIRRILAWPARTVVMAHGTPVEHDARAYLERAFRWLTG
ncbi:MAG: DUF4336 domain-containing protein [Pseudomonadota bacterium]|jgi:hypothetical protein